MSESTESLPSLALQFLEYKRTIGVKYETGEYYINAFLKYANTHNPDTWLPSKELVSGWCATAAGSPGSLYNMSAVIREFGKYLVMHGYTDAYVLPPKRGSRLDPHLPYFFAPDEIAAFFYHCDRIQALKERPGRELVLPAIFRLLYCCGIRCREAQVLRCSDMYLQDKYFDIIESKGRSRRIFISDDLSDVLKQYNAQMALVFPDRVYFFPRNQHESYGSNFIPKNFSRIWQVALPEFQSPLKPRAYDFRHNLAIANLNRWSEQEKDVNVMLEYLMRYMGHSQIQSTLYYFHFVPEYYRSFVQKSRALESLIPEVPREEE